MKKLNKKFMLPVIAGVLTIGTLTSPILADSSAVNNNYQIVVNKEGVVEDKRPGTRKPVITKNTITLKMNNNLINIECKSGTYEEVFNYIEKQGYSDFTVKNYWGTQVYSWYKYDSQKICEVFINDKDGIVENKVEGVRKPIITENTITLKMNGNLINIDCKSGTYKEVFDYINNLGYTDFTVKNYWGTQVYSWYKYDSKKICEVFFK